MMTGCQPDASPKKNETKAPPQLARGKDYEVLIIAPKAQMEAVRTAFDSVFSRYYPMLNRPEWWFSPTYIPLGALSSATRHHHTIFLVWARPPSKVPEFLTEITDTADLRSFFRQGDRYRIYHDVWAAGQQVWLWTARNPRHLLQYALQHQQEIIEKLDAHQKKRIARKLYRNGWHRDFARKMQEKWGHSLRIPTVFSIDKVVENPRPPFTHFFWARTETKKTFSNIIGWGISPTPDSLSLSTFADWHDTMGRRYIPGPSEGSYFVTERAFLSWHPTTLAGRPAYVVRGLWRVQNDFMGGPFIAYVIPTGDRVIVVEGFLHAPGTFQKRFMKRLEIILETFKQ